jgi:hypothetical protein
VVYHRNVGGGPGKSQRPRSRQPSLGSEKSFPTFATPPDFEKCGTAVISMGSGFEHCVNNVTVLFVRSYFVDYSDYSYK